MIFQFVLHIYSVIILFFMMGALEPLLTISVYWFSSFYLLLILQSITFLFIFHNICTFIYSRFKYLSSSWTVWVIILYDGSWNQLVWGHFFLVILLLYFNIIGEFFPFFLLASLHCVNKIFYKIKVLSPFYQYLAIYSIHII